MATYHKALAFFLLGSALITPARIQTSETISDTTKAYCASLKCWQKKPCLEHHHNEHNQSTWHTIFPPIVHQDLTSCLLDQLAKRMRTNMQQKK